MKIGGKNNKILLSKVSMILLMARIGIARLCIIILILSSIHTLGNNEMLIRQIAKIEQYVFHQTFISDVIRQCPKTMDQMMELSKIYWDISEKAFDSISAIFTAMINPRDSGISDALKSAQSVIKMMKDMKLMENLDLTKIMKMVQMMNALNATKPKKKNRNKIKVKPKPKL